MTLGEKIKELRRLRGNSQQELADILGIHKNTLSLIECDKTLPKIHTLYAIAKYFNTTMEFLIDDNKKV